MASKRAREDGDVQERSHKRHKKGFSVGPQNLPDGTYRRKVDKIKKDLIHKAKVKKDFAKLKARLEKQEQRPTSNANEQPPTRHEGPPASLEPHPDRLALLSQQERPENPAGNNSNKDRSKSSKHEKPPHQRRPQYNPFSKAAQEAKRRKKEEERRQRERERIEKEKQEKAEQRDRHRKIMANARRGGKNGQRSLGTEGEVLLERVKKLMGAERSSGVVSFGRGKKESAVQEKRAARKE